VHGASLSSLFSTFATAILPIIAIAGVGYALGRSRDVDPGPLNTITVYVLAPALVFHSLATTAMGGQTFALIAVGVVAYTLAMVVLAGGVGRLGGQTEPLLGAFVLTSAFSNAGNYGIPLSAFAFGATGRSTAVLYIAVQGTLLYTLGTYIAARSGSGSPLEGMKQVFTIPLVYAVVVALVARWGGVVPPADSTAMTTIKLVGDASIPVMLLIVGIQLAGTNYASALRYVWQPNVLKMLVAPVVALAIALALGFSNPTVGRVFVLECATPSAVTPLILVGEFSEPGESGPSPTEYVSAAVFTSTLVSVPTLTVLIAVLQSGIVL
jgi:hypothetical protein